MSGHDEPSRYTHRGTRNLRQQLREEQWLGAKAVTVYVGVTLLTTWAAAVTLGNSL